MLQYEKGQPYPDNRYMGVKDGSVIEVLDTTFNVLFFIDKPTRSEREGFNNGKLSYGIYQEKHVPFITLELPHLEFDASFNIKNCTDPNEIQKWLDSSDNAMALFLIDADSYLIQEMRLIGLNHDFTKDLREILRDQNRHYNDRHEVDTEIRSIQRRTSLKQMVQQSRKYRHR
ncbi:hypothetical protein WJU16_02740 [Chitinophaga pollutisoli]|uniref:Uncharacterized protein n=1 Tax=Chitinophaga pollutisoli TaxID=3133966 RepID=A0ABZ2YRG2_9BACT